MVKLFRFLIIALLAALPLQAQVHPVSGKPFTVRYNPPANSALGTAAGLELVYVYDFWGARFGTHLALWENVLRPDSDRTFRVPLEKTLDGWTASIKIHPRAALLSYYVTDGKVIEANNEETYTEYIYRENGNPMPGAHFCMVPFRKMAREEPGKVVQEAETEINLYPENFRAYPLYFSLLLEQGKGDPRIQERILNKISQLEKTYGDSTEFLNMAARVCYYTLHDQKTGMLFRERIDPAKMWPDVVLMYDREKIQSDQRREEQESENRRMALNNNELPQIILTDALGKSIELPGAPGTVTVLSFWATTSENAKKYLGFLQAIQQKFASQGVRVFAVDLDPDRSVGDKYMTSMGFTVMNVGCQPAALTNLGVDAIPQTYLIDKKNIVRTILRGYEDTQQQDLEKIVGELLR
jgi:hypothetical protein